MTEIVPQYYLFKIKLVVSDSVLCIFVLIYYRQVLVPWFSSFVVVLRKANHEVNYKRIKTVDFFVATYLVGRNNNHHDTRIRQTASTKPTLSEHDNERYYGK